MAAVLLLRQAVA